MFFRLEMFDKDGKVLESRHVELSGVGDVAKASESEKIKGLKKLAAQKGYGFRVKREDD